MGTNSAGIKAGKGYVELGTDSGPLEKGLEAAKKKFEAWGKGIAALGAGIAASAAAVTAPFLMGLSVFSELGSSIASASRISGVGIEDLQTLSHALKVDFDELSIATKKMDAFISNAAKGAPAAASRLDQIGLSLESLAGLSEGDRLRKIGDAINRTYADISQRHAAATEIFGRGGLKLDFGGDVGAREDRARQLGGVLSPADVALAKEFALAQKEMGIAIRGLWASIGAAAAPVMRDFFRLVTDIVIRVREWVDAHRPLLETIFRVADVLVTVGAIIGFVGAAIIAAGYALPYLIVPLKVLTAAVGLLSSAFLWVPLAIGAAILGLSLFAGAGIDVPVDVTPPAPIEMVQPAPVQIPPPIVPDASEVPIEQPDPAIVVAIPPDPVDVPIVQPDPIQVDAVPPVLDFGPAPPVDVAFNFNAQQPPAPVLPPVPPIEIASSVDAPPMPTFPPAVEDVTFNWSGQTPPTLAPPSVPPVQIATVFDPPVPIAPTLPETEIATCFDQPPPISIVPPDAVEVAAIQPPPVQLVAVPPNAVTVPIVQPEPIQVTANVPVFNPPAIDPVEVPFVSSTQQITPPVLAPAPTPIPVINPPVQVTAVGPQQPVPIPVANPSPVMIGVTAPNPVPVTVQQTFEQTLSAGPSAALATIAENAASFASIAFDRLSESIGTAGAVAVSAAAVAAGAFVAYKSAVAAVTAATWAYTAAAWAVNVVWAAGVSAAAFIQASYVGLTGVVMTLAAQKKAGAAASAAYHAGYVVGATIFAAYSTAIAIVSSGFGVLTVAHWAAVAGVWAYSAAVAIGTAVVWAYNASLVALGTGFGLITLGIWASGVALTVWGGFVSGIMAVVSFATASWGAVAAGASMIVSAAFAVAKGVMLAYTFVVGLFTATSAGATAAQGGMTVASIAAAVATKIYAVGATIASVATAVLTAGINLLIGALIVFAAFLAGSAILTFVGGLYGIASAAIGAISACGQISISMGRIGGVIDDLLSKFAAFGPAFSNLVPVALTAFDGIKAAFETRDWGAMWEIFKLAAQIAIEELKPVATALWISIKFGALTVFNAIGDAFTTALRAAFVTIKAEWARLNSGMAADTLERMGFTQRANETRIAGEERARAIEIQGFADAAARVAPTGENAIAVQSGNVSRAENQVIRAEAAPESADRQANIDAARARLAIEQEVLRTLERDWALRQARAAAEADLRAGSPAAIAAAQADVDRLRAIIDAGMSTAADVAAWEAARVRLEAVRTGGNRDEIDRLTGQLNAASQQAQDNAQYAAFADFLNNEIGDQERWNAPGEMIGSGKGEKAFGSFSSAAFAYVGGAKIENNPAVRTNTILQGIREAMAAQNAALIREIQRIQGLGWA